MQGLSSAERPLQKLEIALAEMTPPAEPERREAPGAGSPRRRVEAAGRIRSDLEPLDLVPLQAHIQRVVNQAIDERLRAIFARLGTP